MIPSWYQRPSPPSNFVASGTCVRVVLPWVIRFGSGTARQVTELVGRDDRHLEQPAREIRVVDRREAIEAGVALVLGQVHALADGVHRRGLVGEVAERGPGNGGQDAGGIGLPDHSALVLLAGEPCAPWRGTAGAVEVRAGEDPVGALDRTVGTEADGRGAAAGRGGCLGVRHQHMAVVGGAVGGGAVSGEVPGVGRPVHRLAAAGYLAAGEPLRQHEPGIVGRLERPVGAVPRARGRRQHVAQERGREQQSAGRRHAAGQELPTRDPRTAAYPDACIHAGECARSRPKTEPLFTTFSRPGWARSNSAPEPRRQRAQMLDQLRRLAHLEVDAQHRDP